MSASLACLHLLHVCISCMSASLACLHLLHVCISCMSARKRVAHERAAGFRVAAITFSSSSLSGLAILYSLPELNDGRQSSAATFADRRAVLSPLPARRAEFYLQSFVLRRSGAVQDRKDQARRWSHFGCFVRRRR